MNFFDRNFSVSYSVVRCFVVDESRPQSFDGAPRRPYFMNVEVEFVVGPYLIPFCFPSVVSS